MMRREMVFGEVVEVFIGIGVFIEEEEDEGRAWYRLVNRILGRGVIIVFFLKDDSEIVKEYIFEDNDLMELKEWCGPLTSENDVKMMLARKVTKTNKRMLKRIIRGLPVDVLPPGISARAELASMAYFFFKTPNARSTSFLADSCFILYKIRFLSSSAV
ncbi:hypothetical protein Tco_0802710 [Tanacetum coccineum]|uniref:Agenet-like domain-containing protein n=1 Tax=Tanacetum coccineum TaxID=301880 RepID=A0ABQ5A3P1_9ASTR